MKIYYSPNLLKEWKCGQLQRKWKKQYPNIFDEDDLRIALSQRKNHFGEWYAALHYAKMGYRVLIEKYIYYAHPAKIRILKRRWPGLLERLRHLGQDYKCQPPDLLLYKRERFQFVEVKRDSDYEKPTQKKMFKALSKRLKTHVRYCYVLAKKRRKP